MAGTAMPIVGEPASRTGSVRASVMSAILDRQTARPASGFRAINPETV